MFQLSLSLSLSQACYCWHDFSLLSFTVWLFPTKVLGSLPLWGWDFFFFQFLVRCHNHVDNMSGYIFLIFDFKSDFLDWMWWLVLISKFQIILLLYSRVAYNLCLVGRVLSMDRETRVQSLVESYQRLKKWYLVPPCLTLSIIRYVSRVKWSNPGIGAGPSSYTSVY